MLQDTKNFAFLNLQNAVVHFCSIKGMMMYSKYGVALYSLTVVIRLGFWANTTEMIKHRAK